MQIGITGVEIDSLNKEVADLTKCIKAEGHEVKIMYSDALGMEIGRQGVKMYHARSRPSGSGSDKELLDPDAVLLRHLGIIRDYEQFTYRLWCIRALELSGITVMNPLMNWLMASDKLATSIVLSKNKLPIPDTASTEQMFMAYESAKKFRVSVVKPLRSAMGFGVFRIDNADIGMHIFSYFTNLSKPIYVQKYLVKEGGGDYRVVVVNGEAIGAEFRKGINWKSNVSQGARPIKARMDKELSELAVKASEALGLDYAGIDIAKTKEGYCILETNPTLSWQGFKSVTGINPAEYIVRHLIEKARS